jgi:hypothetical protein
VTNGNANPSSHEPRALLHPLLWAVFLGASWTWVIGMFLPVLLVRDYGVWGWIVFALPNVLGAAAMGWALRDADASGAFVRRHAPACYAFSLVTVAFHVCFAMWMINRLRGAWGLMALAAFVVAALALRGNVARAVGGVATMGVSLAIWVALRRQGDFLTLPPATGGQVGGPLGAVWLLPVFVIGFALCPYLDLTFHRARQNTSPGGGRLAFGVGFGVVFFSMIVFTLLYARWIAPAAAGIHVSPLATSILCGHLIVQSAFTVAAHVRELPSPRMFPDPAAARTLGAMVLAILLGAAVIGWVASTHRTVRGHDFGEVVYWCFLGFYGLVFPGYLWLHGFPGRPGGITPTPRTMGLLAVVVAVAFPMYWMGFVEGRPAWLLPGAAILLAARLLVPRFSSPSPRTSPTPVHDRSDDADPFRAG